MRAILTFHSVDRSGSVLSIAPEELRELVSEIQASGHVVVPLPELLASDADGRVALTFDDGYRSVAEEAAPVLRAAGVPASVFLTTDYVGRDNRWPGYPSHAPFFELMTWAQACELAADGFSMEAHTCSHPDLRHLDDAALDAELRACNDAIEERIGRRPRGLAYPYGAFDARVARRAGRHYGFAVTTRMGVLSGRPPDPLALPRLETFYFRGSRPLGGFGSRGFGAYLSLRALLRRLRGG